MPRVFLQGLTWRSIVLILFESTLIIAAVLVAAVVRLGTEVFDELIAQGILWRGLLVAGVTQLCLYYGELYDLRLVRDRRELMVRLLQSLGAASLILGFLYFWLPDLVIGRGVFLIAAGLILALVVGWRVGFEWISRNVGPRERLLLVGTNQAAVNLANELIGRSDLGVEVVGFVDPDPVRVGDTIVNPTVIGVVSEIPRIVHERNVDRVVVSLSDARGKLRMDELLEMKLGGVKFDHLADVYEEYTGKIAVENLRPSWLIFSPGFEKAAVHELGKRSFDVVVAAVMLVALLPVMAITALLVKLTSPGPALYHQERVGKDNRPFVIHKFRSMRQDAEAATGAVWAQKDDPRVTRFGTFMRKTRLDELPQLWNVLRGDMSFVGPRPERPSFVAQLTEQIPFYGLRHAVKPGVTGWAQVRYTYGASVEDAMEKLQYDLFYIKHRSAALDLYVLFETVRTVVLRRGT